MRKTILAIGSACVALSGMAASSQCFQHSDHSKIVKTYDVKDFPKLKVANPSSPMKKIAPGLSSIKDVITSVEGEKVDVTVTSSGLTMSFLGLEEYKDQMYASHVVYGDNNEVYFYEIFPYLPTQSYFKGIKEGDKIVVDFPQAIYYDDSMGDIVEAYYLTLLTMQDDWYVAEEKSSLIFSIDEYGTLTAEGLSRNTILGVADSEDGQWIGLGAWNLSLSSFDDKVVELPDDYQVVENFWTSVGNGYGWQINFAQGGDEIYFQGLSERMPEAWVKGTVDYADYTATVSIAQDQYVGDYKGYHIFTKCVKMTVDENGNIFYDTLMDPDYAYQLVWDFEEETMVAKDKDVVLLFNTSKNDIYFLNDLIDLKLIHQESFEGVPADPYGLKFEDFMQEEGFSFFTFDLPANSTEGDYLLIDDLSYVVYVNDEEWIFDAEDYALEESLEEVPWSFDGYWIMKGFDSTQHKVAFFVEGISTLGVQSIYKYDGEETRSEIVTLDLNENSVAAINPDKKVASVKYYDIAGQEIVKPVKGLCIARVIYSDGSVASFKSIVR